MSEQRWYVRNDNEIDNPDAHPEFWGLYDRSQEHGRECVLSIEHFTWNDGTDSSDLPPLIAAALNAAEESKRLLHEAEKLIATAEGWWETFAYPERTAASDHCKELCERSQQWLAEYQLTKGESNG